MLVTLYILLSSLLGFCLRYTYLEEHSLLGKTSPGLLKLVTDFMLGIIPVTTLLYFTTLLWAKLLPTRINPLLASNITTGIIVLALIFYFLIKKPLKLNFQDRVLSIKDKVQDKNQIRRSIFYLVSILVFTVFTWLLTGFVLRSDNQNLGAGFSVFSDFAPHTAVVESFARGRNYPTEYPHFAGDGIQYHFFFFFLAANFRYLGLDLAAAINLPSALGMLSFSIVLGSIAVKWTRRDAAFLIAPLFVYLRSSNAIWHWLRSVPSLARESGIGIFTYIKNNNIFIGRGPNDDWGLWNLNVYANQRHLLFVFAAGLILLLLFVPSLKKATIKTWIQKEAWLIQDIKQYIPAFILFFCMPYWHGSVTVAILLILAFMAVFSHDKLAYLITAVVALTMALLYSRLFSGSSGDGLSIQFQWGFIAPNKSFFGVMGYLWELLGLSFPALLLLPFMQASSKKKILSFAMILPLIFALTVSLTPDVTVNHKYIMMSQILAGILLTDLILRFWRVKFETSLPVGKIVASILVLVLTLTGWVDLLTYKNKNKHLFWIPETSNFQSWILEDTSPTDVFLTPPWHYHPFFLTGRKAWYGHSYYAWSAGHDTTSRELDVKRLYAGDFTDPRLMVEYCMEHNIKYAIVTDELRSNPDFELNEAYFKDSFLIAGEFSDMNGATVYQIYE